MAQLRDLIQESIRNSDTGISFAEFMAVALYDPENGYYAQPRAIGRGGDFYTSVSVGPCFGMLLARQILQIQRDLEEIGDFRVVEQGAHDGQLAQDIVEHLPEEMGYLILETVPSYVTAQRARLGDRVEVDLHPGTAGPSSSGVFLCNELVDAFPVRRLVRKDGEWQELRVVLDGSGAFTQEPFPIPVEDEELSRFFPAEPPPDGHILEVCPVIETWMEAISELFEHGVAFIIDYGMGEADLLAPERRDGTLRGYRQHKAVDDPFSGIGETDLTTQVNFTHLERVAERHGWRVLGCPDQGHFLTGIAADWLREIEGQTPSPQTAALIRQFQTLTHPGNMGRSFRVLVLARGDVSGQLDGLTWGA